ncbi:nuclear transport factor 2 family protein [Candidatus Uabimicrobium sp. HlEnr_7]|uniref:nuclear transport factor 2 family protein n=1 Tax=Candidatus Uabimicrobium helgolandensis TaxID=3095367 RepID=UPI003555DDE1
MNKKTVISIFVIVFCFTLTYVQIANAQEQEQTTYNKNLVSNFFELLSNGEIDRAFYLVNDDVSWWVPGDLPFSGTKNKNQYLQIVGNIQKGFPQGLKLKVKSMISENNKVAAEVESDGVHINGKKYNNKYHFLITIENNSIIAVKEYMDTLHLYQLIQ